MSVSQPHRCQHDSCGRWRQVFLTLCLTMGVLVLAVGSAGHAAAQQAMSRELYAPFANALSASSWLLVTGHDPRYLDAGTAMDWSSGSLPAAPSTATQGQSNPGKDAIISQQVGLLPVTSDPSLAVDPEDANHLVLAASALDLPAIAIYVSADGGKTWDGPRQVPYFPLDSGSAGRPVVTFDEQGTVYLVSRSIGVDMLPLAAQPLQGVRTRITVATSDDGGLTWNEPVSVALSTSDVTTASDETGQTVSSATISFLDWPSLLVAADPQHPERAILYLTYTEFRAPFSALNAGALANGPVESTIRLTRSTDGGATWSDPLAVSPTAMLSLSPAAPTTSAGVSPAADQAQPPTAPPTPPGPLTTAQDRQVVQGAQAVALSDGTLLVAYFDSTADGPQQGLARIMVATSTDGGRTFAEPAVAGIFREIGQTPRTSFVRWWSSSFPRLTVGEDDAVLIATTARPVSRPGDDADILLLRSPDGGASWDPPAPLSDDISGNQFFPALSAAEDGAVHVIWSDSGDDPHGVSFAISHAQSQDGGATWEGGDTATDGRLSGEMSNTLLGFPGGVFLGDGNDLGTADGQTYAVWPDTRLASRESPNQQIGFVNVPIAPGS